MFCFQKITSYSFYSKLKKVALNVLDCDRPSLIKVLEELEQLVCKKFPFFVLIDLSALTYRTKSQEEVNTLVSLNSKFGTPLTRCYVHPGYTYFLSTIFKNPRIHLAFYSSMK